MYFLKRVILAGLVGALFIIGVHFFPERAQAVYPFDFGGRVLSIYPCVNGLWVTIGPPTPGLFFYVPGFSGLKAYGPPTHPGQQVLGKSYGAMVCLVPCPVGVCPIGAGWLVTPNAGSSAL